MVGPRLQEDMPRVLLQEVERKALRFPTPVTLTKLGMFSAVGALYGTHLSLQDLRLSKVASVMSTHERLGGYPPWHRVYFESVAGDATIFSPTLPSAGRLLLISSCKLQALHTVSF